MVTNTCQVLVTATLTIAYYDRQGLQMGNGIEISTLAPGSKWQFFHSELSADLPRFIANAKIIDVNVTR